MTRRATAPPSFRRNDRVICDHDSYRGIVEEVSDDCTWVLVWFSMLNELVWVKASSVSPARDFDSRDPFKDPGKRF